MQAGSASCARVYARQGALALCGNDAVAVATRCSHTPPRVIDEERERGASPRSSSRGSKAHGSCGAVRVCHCRCCRRRRFVMLRLLHVLLHQPRRPLQLLMPLCPLLLPLLLRLLQLLILWLLACQRRACCTSCLALHAAPCGAVLLHQLLYLLLHWQCRQVRRARSPCGDGYMQGTIYVTGVNYLVGNMLQWVGVMALSDLFVEVGVKVQPVLLRRVRSVRPEVTLGTCRFIALLASTATAIAVLKCSNIAHPRRCRWRACRLA